MNELKLKFENTIFYNGIEDYIGSLKGIKEVKMDKENNEIYVKYDSSIISILVLQNEILLFLNSLRIPAIVGFNKYSKICNTNNIRDYQRPKTKKTSRSWDYKFFKEK